MPLHGDPAVFAIEWEETRRDDLQHRVFGHFCFWARGERIGRYDEEIGLGTPVIGLRQFLSHAPERKLPALDGRPREEVFAYVHDVQIPAELRDDWRYDAFLRRTFHLDDVGGDAFLSAWDIILLNEASTDTQRFIWRDDRDWPSTHLSEAFLPDHTFDTVAQQFIAACVLPTTLWEQLHWDGREPIVYDGRTLYHQYRWQVGGWVELHVRRLGHNATVPQGLRMKSGRVDLDYNGQRTRDLILWADETPDECVVRVIGQQGAVLKIWNQWREPNTTGPCGSGGTSGMLVDALPHGLRLSCSDGLGPVDFTDLVVELEVQQQGGKGSRPAYKPC